MPQWLCGTGGLSQEVMALADAVSFLDGFRRSAPRSDNLRDLLLMQLAPQSLDPPGCPLTGQDAFPMLGHEEEA